MKYPNYDVNKLEPEILAFWQSSEIVPKLRRKNQEGQKFYFLDGPPYTSGKLHLGHAWNYALKDICLRYKRMQGFNVWDRNGFDVHGLPTEHKVMDKFNLKTKEDIQRFGIDKFTRECQSFCLEMAEVMTKDLTRMGVTFNLSDPYMALKTKFMEGEWDLIKKAYEQEKLYYGEKVLTWCQYCETAVAKHECEYKNVNERSIFVKFPIKNMKNEYLIIWTTTPWTIPFNLAVMVNPEIDYVKAEVEGEKWILAKALAGVVVSSVANKKMKIAEQFKGKELEGVEYVHPFERFIKRYAELKKDHPNVHTVILSEKFVDTSAGSGLVHSAPGCGPEDQEACRPYHIPPFNNLNEEGFFPEEMGKFFRLRAKISDDKFIQALKEENALIATTVVEHEYPHCWRCKQPVIFRITYQWFFKVEELKEKILQDNKKVHWVPDTALNAYESWIKNLKDNTISRQRYWGTPLPIWKCAHCEKIKVVGSTAELKELGAEVPKNIHLPWIDEVKLTCNCNHLMERVPDIIDVWVDAGTASWNCLDNDPKKIMELFPADLILEAREQTRLWFSLLSICSHLYLGENAFQNVYVYGMLNDIEGKKMSKSVGNIISPYEFIDKYGVDVLRFYMCQNNAGEDINFSWDECGAKQRQLHILWNIHQLLINLSQENELNPFILNGKMIDKSFSKEEDYILSKLHSAIKQVTKLMESYQIDLAIAPIAELFLELSRTYIQIVREKSVLGTKEEKEVVIYTIGKVLLDCLKMFNIIAPFISEAIYQNLRDEFGLKEESISHFSWPNADRLKINPDLEKEMETAKNIIQAALHGREKARLGLRWPVSEIVVATENITVLKAVENLQKIIQRQTNAKAINVVKSLPIVTTRIKADYAKIGPIYENLSPQIIAKLATISADSILSHLQKNNVYKFDLGGKEIEITKEMLIIEREVPFPYQEGEAKTALVYVNTERSAGLEAEGFAREVMRQVQSLRKKAGLQKTDSIHLFVKSDQDMKKNLEMFKEEIMEKVGAKKVDISANDPVKLHQNENHFKIKEEEFSVWFEKV